MNIALVGWGIETKSAYRHYGNEHQYLIVSEEPLKDAPDSENVTIQSLDSARKPGLTGNVDDLSYLEGLEGYDLIIYSPSAHKNLEKVYGVSSPFWQRAKTTIEVFFEVCPTKNIVGVTGTKGKGTTTTLITKMLEANDIPTYIGGNIGIPVLDLLPKINRNDWVVLELSSFQLYKLTYSPHIAVHLMMIPEHIAEWHKTMDDYVSSKRNIFANQNNTDIAIYHATNTYAVENVESSAGRHIPYLQEPGAHLENNQIVIDGKVIIEVEKVALLGNHNLENVCAAITAVWQVHQDIAAYQTVLESFTGLEHRLQLVGELNGIRYYDDSFGTTPDTAVVAMDAFTEPKVMIVGGHDKGNEFSGMIDRLSHDDIRGIVCLGPTGKYISSRLIEMGVETTKIISKESYNEWTMSEIIAEANKFAQSGDIILLSTGSASFGIFKDYKDRGNQFIQAIKDL
jgi:UDP-N-acetylmuramoylalanine--D-glutamate ligase